MLAKVLAIACVLLLGGLSRDTLAPRWPHELDLSVRPTISADQMDVEARLIKAALAAATSAGRFFPQDLANFKQQWQSLRPLLLASARPAHENLSRRPWYQKIWQYVQDFWWPPKIDTMEFCTTLRQALAAYPDQWTQVRTLKPYNMCGTALRVYQGEVGPNLAVAIKRHWMIKKMMLGPRSFYVVAITDKIKGDEEFQKALANIEADANLILDLRHLGPKFPFAEMQDFIPRNFQKRLYQSGQPMARVMGFWHQQIQTQLQTEIGKTPVLASHFTKEDLNNERRPLRQTVNFLGTGRLRGPLWILVDRTCFRECEDFLSMLQFRPSTALVGQNTPGEAHFDPPATSGMLLPYSHIFLQINLNYGELPGQEFIELQGQRPKIRVERGFDAWQKLTQILKGDGDFNP